MKRHNKALYKKAVAALTRVKDPVTIPSVVTLSDFAEATYQPKVTQTTHKVIDVDLGSVSGSLCGCDSHCNLTEHEAEVHLKATHEILKSHPAVEQTAENLVILYSKTSNCLRLAQTYA